MKITNKIESTNKIKKLRINRFPEEIFKQGETEKVKAFLKRHPAPLYAIRDKSKSCGDFKLKVAADKVLEEISDYNLFSINVSSANYSDNQLLAGEIEFLSNGEVYATLSTDPTASARSAVSKPEINISTDIFDDKTLNKIPHFNYIYSYIIKNNLKDVVVEFSLFDKELGINKEKIVVYELRTHY